MPTINIGGFYIIIIILSIIAMLANGLVVYITVKRWKSMSLNLKIVSVTATFDLCNCIFSTLVSLYALIELNITGFNHTICQLFGGFFISFIFISVALLALFTFERYYKVCWNRSIKHKTALYLGISVILSITIPTIVLAILGQYKLSFSGCFCVPSDTILGYIVKAELIVLLCIAVPLITFCYIHISLSFGNRARPISFFGGGSNPILGSPFKSADRSVRVPHSVLIRSISIMLVYNLLFIPQLASSIWRYFSDEQKPVWLELLGAIGLFLVTLVDPIIILGMHSCITKELKDLFSCLHCKPNNIQDKNSLPVLSDTLR